jgi:hypothetical protein
MACLKVSDKPKALSMLAMKAYKGVEVGLHAFLTQPLQQFVVTFTSRPIITR